MIRKPNLSADQMLLLMQYVDGECAGQRLTEAMRLMAVHPDAAAVVSAHQTLGAGVRAAMAQATDTQAFSTSSNVADAVMQRIELATRVPRLVAVPAAPTGGKVLSFPRAVRFAAGAAAFAAVAAGAFFVLNQKASPSLVSGVGASSLSKGVELQEVDSSNPVSVFYLPAAINAKAQSVVVWITDNEASAESALSNIAPSAPSATEKPASIATAAATGTSTATPNLQVKKP
jgi:hypothetical protein